MARVRALTSFALAALLVFGFGRAEASVGVITEYPIPTANSGPNGIVAGSDGNLWFTEYGNAAGHGGNKIGRITPAGSISEFPVPTANSGPGEIAAGPDSNLWFVEDYGNNIGRITPAGSFTEFPIPTAGSRPWGITAGPGDGNLWFTEYAGGKIGRITPAGTITEFTIPTTSSLYGIAVGWDGALWFAEYSANQIGRITTAGAVSEFPLPANGAGPVFMATGPDGNVWYARVSAAGECPGASDSGNRIGRITPAGAVTEFPLPNPNSRPHGITTGPDGNLWFTECSGDRIGRITPGGSIDETPLPTGGSGAYDITTGPVPGSLDAVLWFSEYNGNRIGRLTPPPGPPPQTSIDSHPANPTHATIATFTFTADQPAIFECELDSGPFTACTSPTTYTGLAKRSHLFQVRATNFDSITDPTPAMFAWTNGNKPRARITARPDRLTNDTSATLRFTSSDPGAMFECSLDGSGFAACTSPQDYSSLDDGTHTFAVLARDAAGRGSKPERASWTIDTTAPDTTITKHPSATTPRTTAGFGQTSTEKKSAFQCSLDAAPFTACKKTISYKNLAAGDHTFQVRAIDRAGNPDPTPAVWPWTIAP